ncbi:helix-turn-helix domain-containing protein [Siccirubricoccus soli]|uniref:helix-turn-helix domain-containing protein n=1 Tax=Siccirubricoccus soli TaxID=2899147 RepID=UPI0035191FCE
MLPSPRLLAAARILANVTQAELAKRAGVSVSALRRLEVGDTNARVATVEALTKALIACGIEFLYDQTADREGIRHARPSRGSSDSEGSEMPGSQRKRVGATRSRRSRSETGSGAE